MIYALRGLVLILCYNPRERVETVRAALEGGRPIGLSIGRQTMPTKHQSLRALPQPAASPLLQLQ
jgi:hypothetical protein